MLNEALWGPTNDLSFVGCEVKDLLFAFSRQPRSWCLGAPSYRRIAV